MGLDNYIAYALGFNASDEVIWWVNNVLAARVKNKSDTKGEEVEHILDYLCSDDSPKRLRKMSYEQALASTEKWVATNQKRGRGLEDSPDDILEFLKLENGFSVVELLTESAYKREGFLMNHCLGGYSLDDEITIYSLRDKNNKPHATIEIVKDEDEIRQVKGKGNGDIHPKYIHYILSFLDKVGLEVRGSEMRNLGYMRIHSDYVQLVTPMLSKKEKIVQIKETHYVYKVA